MKIEQNGGSHGKDGYMATNGERGAYGLYFVGQNIFYILLFLFLVTFYTDMGIPALTVAAMTMAVKVWDAVNDPIFGGIVDKVKFKKGKFLPWLRISLFAIPITTIFMFTMPSTLPLSAKVVWSVIAYILWDTAYTICDVPIFGLVTTLTNNQRERIGLMTLGRFAAILATILIVFIVPQVREQIGGWAPTAILLSVIGAILMIPICINAKERVKPVTTQDDPSVKQLLKAIAQNKYMLIFYCGILIAQATNITTTVNMYFARHALGDESLMTFLALALMAPALALAPFMQKLIRKFDKYQLYIFAVIFSVVMIVITYFVGYGNLQVYIVLLVLRGIPFGLITLLMFMFTPDCVEYGIYKLGIDARGISFSIQTFSTKLTAALATSIAALALSLIGFVEGEGAAQLDSFAGDLWIIMNLIPAIGMALSLIPLSKYKLRDKHVQVMAKCNSGDITREEAENLLADVKI